MLLFKFKKEKLEGKPGQGFFDSRLDATLLL